MSTLSLAIFVAELQRMVAETQVHLPYVLSGIGVLWGLHCINYALRYKLNQFGLIPRTERGLIGILLSPFLHGNFNHLFFNSIALFALACLVLLQGYATFFCTTFFIILGSGIALWLFGRRAVHIGASSLIMGYFGYLLADAYFQITPTTIVVALLCVYYFGGSALLAIFPHKKGTSWEGHLFGLIAGIAAAYLSPQLLVNLLR